MSNMRCLPNFKKQIVFQLALGWVFVLRLQLNAVPVDKTDSVILLEILAHPLLSQTPLLIPVRHHKTQILDC